VHIVRGAGWLPILTGLACGSSSGGAVTPGDGGSDILPAVDAGERDIPGVVLTECDPFAPKPLPITLDYGFAAGRDQRGVIYAVGPSWWIFVSEGDTLVRQRVASSFDLTFTVTEHDPPFTLQVDPPASGNDEWRMGIVFGPLSTKTFVIGEQGEELTLLPWSDLASMAVRNLPGEVVLEYAASLPDGRQVVVTRPRDDWSYADFRVFLGVADRMVERAVSTVVRMTDGSTTIWFDLDGGAAIAQLLVASADGGFPSDGGGDGGFVPGTATLQVVGGSISLERQTQPPAGAAYVCRPELL
jgi:hypothetical protein